MSEQDQEVAENYNAFQRLLGSWLPVHRGEYALMRSRNLVAFYDSPGTAYRAARQQFEDGRFSIQEVTDEPIDLGLWSHAGH